MSAATPDLDHQDDQGEPHDVQAMHTPIARELAEPRDGYEPINPFWTILFGVVIFFGGWYTGKFGGDFFSDVYDEAKPPGAAAGPPPQADPVEVGRRLYSRCTQCHQPNGAGVPGKYPPLAGSEWVSGSPAVLSRLLLHGAQGPMTVGGAHYGQEAMPAFANLLKDDQIAAVLTFVRQEWGNTAAPVTAEQVGAARKATAARSAPWTEAELKAITQEDAPPEPKK